MGQAWGLPPNPPGKGSAAPMGREWGFCCCQTPSRWVPGLTPALTHAVIRRLCKGEEEPVRTAARPPRAMGVAPGDAGVAEPRWPRAGRGPGKQRRGVTCLCHVGVQGGGMAAVWSLYGGSNICTVVGSHVCTEWPHSRTEWSNICMGWSCTSMGDLTPVRWRYICRGGLTSAC